MSVAAKRILVTGANGFVGRSLVQHLLCAPGCLVRASVRQAGAQSPRAEQVAVGDINANTDWRATLHGVDTVVHCAARVHVMADAGTAESQARFNEVNVAGTRRLAEQAVAAGVRRIVFLSSVKVNGEATTSTPFSATSQPAPEDAYGRSKWAAEQVLREISERQGIEIAVIRPPLVYGPGVKANFERLMRAVYKGMPLPFGAVDNRRSMIYLGNLVDLIERCITHAGAAGGTFLASDADDLSTRRLIRLLAEAMGKSPRLISVPPLLMTTAARMLGKQDVSERVLGSLQVDIASTCDTLAWRPPYTPEAGIRDTALAWLDALRST